MKIALIGATGNVGSRLLAELRRRGHQTTAIARNVSALHAEPGVTPAQGDVSDATALEALLAGHDAVISTVGFSKTDAAALIGLVRRSGVPRYLVVGGAGSLEVAPGLRLLDAPGFPEAYRAEAEGGGRFLDLLRQENVLDWSFLSPSAMIGPGERTGKFRLGGDTLLTDAEGKSQVSYEDFAVAMIDELENPAHSRRRFTVAN